MSEINQFAELIHRVVAKAMRMPDSSKFLLEFYRDLRAEFPDFSLLLLVTELEQAAIDLRAPIIMSPILREAAADVGDDDPIETFFVYKSLGAHLLLDGSKEALIWLDKAVLVGEAIDVPMELAKLKDVIASIRRDSALLWPQQK